MGWLAICFITLGLVLFLLGFWVPDMFGNTGAFPVSAGVAYFMFLGAAFCVAVGGTLFIVEKLPSRSLVPPILVLSAGTGTLIERDWGCEGYYGYGSVLLTDCGVFVATGALGLMLVGIVFLTRVMQKRWNTSQIKRR